jgi:tetratricopeptide (TPR) repeat protein
MRGAVLAIAACVCSCPLTTSAWADTPPSRWERVSDPFVARAQAVHLAVHEKLMSSASELDPFGVSEAKRLAARALIEREIASGNKNVVLQFDLGIVHNELHDYPNAAAVLRAALERAPDHPAAEQGWWNLAVACGHLGDHGCERRAYTEDLRLESEESRRVTAALNLAETEMHLGDLREAIEGYRETIRMAGRVQSRETAPLAVWGLAVALDRSGDRVSAEREARFALELEKSTGYRNLLHSSVVFFYPPYEVAWYDGLGFMALARQATRASDAVDLWRLAERAFSAYVAAAERAKTPDRWLPLAKARLVLVRGEREQAERRQKKERTRPPEVGDAEVPL